MSNHMQLVQKTVEGIAIRAAGEGIGIAMALTDLEVVAGKAGLFGRWGAKVQRFPLAALASVRVIPNPGAALLQIEFATVPPGSLTVMYEPHAKADFERVTLLLEGQLQRLRVGGL